MRTFHGDASFPRQRFVWVLHIRYDRYAPVSRGQSVRVKTFVVNLPMRTSRRLFLYGLRSCCCSPRWSTAKRPVPMKPLTTEPQIKRYSSRLRRSIGCPNGNLVIKFSFCTSSWTFNTVQVGLTIDGKPIGLPHSMHPNSVLAAWVLDDAVSVELPVAAVRGLSANSEIQAILGAYSYRLSGANLDTLRNIVERIR